MHEIKIMVVEDDELIQRQLQAFLDDMGYRLVSVLSRAEDAIGEARKKNPDIVLMDIRLKGKMDGIEAAEHIRADSGSNIIFITGFANDDMIQRARVTEPMGYLVKPFDYFQLKAAIEMGIYKAHLEAERRKTAAALRREVEINASIMAVGKEMISSVYDIKKIAELILNNAVKMTHSKYGYVSEIRSEKEEITIHALTERAILDCTILDNDITVPVNAHGKFQSLWGHALNTRRAFYTNKPQNHSSSSGMPEGHIPLTRFISVPVIIEDRLVGQIALANADMDYSEIELKIIEQLGELYALALHRQKNEEEKEALQRQLQKIQKIEAIGVLAGGIAHDFNNILFPIIGYAEMGIEDLEEDNEVRKYLQSILSGARRARDLVNQILTFSREQDYEVRPMAIQPILKEALKLTKATLPSTIEIRQRLDPDCGQVMASPTQIYQIAMNLITNAYHAMEEKGGILDVALFEQMLENDRCTDDMQISGQYVCMMVSDTGTGMTPATIERIFDPYFTTKAREKGTGLGLAVVLGIVKVCKGRIQVESEPNKGTVMKVFLPRTDATADRLGPASRDFSADGKEHILVVDDEGPVVRLEKLILERSGYRITAFTKSLDAIECFQKTPGDFDLVITDMTMPGMTGIELSDRLKTIRSDIPVILCTGFSGLINEDKAKDMGIKGYIMKPVVKSELLKVVRHVLDTDRENDE